MLTFGSLFAGVGGFDLGFERAGMECRWQVEIEPFCKRVLAKHWPDVRRWDDVRTFPPAGAWSVDVICGGFPCQDISNANADGLGLDGERSGLWRDYSRIVRELRPSIVVVENVAALLNRGMDRVLSDLAESGFDAEWQVLPAAAFGAPHIRERVFIVAYAEGVRWRTGRTGRPSGGGKGTAEQALRQTVFDAKSIETGDDGGQGARGWRMSQPGIRCGFTGRQWAAEPAVGRVADGVPSRVDRLRGLGNAVVPQIAQWLGERIVEAHLMGEGGE
jgi:DNA (cytosine-5)-methyltransferase 1